MKKILVSVVGFISLILILMFGKNIMGILEKVRNKSDQRSKISIIVPVYKVEKWLPECMDSLINQTLKEIEIICIDDGSPDNCGKILDDYSKKDKRIRVIHQDNQGVSAARNAGLDVASGEYITFVDPDDFIHPLTCEHIYNCAKKDDLDILEFKGIAFNDGDNHNFSSLSCEKEKNQDIDFSSGENISWKDYIYKFNECVWCHLYKLDMINKYNIRFPVGITPGEDDCFNFISIVGTKKIKIIPAIFYNYRLRTGSTMNTLNDEKAENARSNLISPILYGWNSKNVIYNNSSFLLSRLVWWLGSISKKDNAKKILDSFKEYNLLKNNIIKNCDNDVKQRIEKLNNLAKVFKTISKRRKLMF